MERWYCAWGERQRDTTPAARIGIEELSLKKHRQFFAVIVDHMNRHVLESREKAAVVKFLRES